MNDTEIKEALTQINTVWSEYKKKIDEKYEEMKSNDGKVSAETKQSLAKLEEKMSSLEKFKERLENLERVAREFKSREEQEEVETKSSNKNGFSLQRRGTPEERKSAREAFNRFIRAGHHTNNGDRAGAGDFRWGEGLEKKSMSIISDPDGGFMVTNDFSGRVVEHIFETSPIRQVASVQQISTIALEGMNDLDQAGAEWDGETTTPGDTTTPKIGRWKIPVFELRARTYATMQFLEDAGIDVEAWLAMKQADKFARTENNAFVVGDGNGKPRGFLSYPIVSAASWNDTTNASGSLEYVPTGASGAFQAAPNAADCLLNLVYSLKDFYRKNGSWGMTRSSIGVVRALKDSYGRFLWEPALTNGEPARLLSFPVNEFNDMPEIAANSLSIAFADWKTGYQIVDRLGIATLRDPYTAQPYVKFISRKRVGGAVIDFQAIKVLKFAAS